MSGEGEDELLERLLSRYAALGEDAVDLAASTLPDTQAERLKVIASLRRSAADMLAFAEAARASLHTESQGLHP